MHILFVQYLFESLFGPDAKTCRFFHEGIILALAIRYRFPIAESHSLLSSPRLQPSLQFFRIYSYHDWKLFFN